MDIFNLAQGHSERDIKRAYAKALKTIDVDEHPEQFQQLHQAYKQALFDFEQAQADELKEQAKESFIPSGQSVVDASNLDSVLAMENQLAMDAARNMGESNHDLRQENHEQWLDHDALTAPLADEDFSHQAQAIETDKSAAYTQQLAKLEGQLEQLLSEPNQCIKLQAWLFLNEFPELTDYDFWLEASQLVYDKIAFSQSADFKGKKPDISREVLMFIDSIFNWFEYLADPEEPAYDHHQCLYNRIQDLHGISPPSANTQNGQQKGEGFHIPLPGILALVVDILAFFSAFNLLQTLTSQSALNFIFNDAYIPTLGLVYYLACLISPLQGTLGQYINNIKVINYHDQEPSFLDSLRRSSILVIISVFTVYTKVYNPGFYDGPASWIIMFLPMISIGSWFYFKNTKLVERSEKGEVFRKDTLSISAIAALVDWFFILLLMVGIQEIFSYPAILALEGKHGFIIYLIYYAIFLLSPLNGTLGHYFLKVKVVNSELQRPNIIDIIRRSSGLIFWTACSYLSLLVATEQQELFKGPLGILIPILCFFVWKQFKQSHLVVSR